MYSELQFQRNFYIFSNEDAGFEAGQKPTGHVKIEVRDGKGRLHAVAQNLRDGGDRFEYILYLLYSGRDSVDPVRVGRLETHLSKSELVWSFNPHNVGQSGYPVDAFDVIAILVEYADRQGGNVQCPLAAYRKNRVQWRNIIMESIMKKKIQPVENAREDAAKPASVAVAETVTNEIATDSNIIDENIAVEVSVWGTVDESEREPQQTEREPAEPEQPPQPAQPAKAAQPPQQVLSDINTGCVYLNGNMCGAFVQSGAVIPNPCSTCNANRGEQTVQEQLPGDLSKLRAMLDSNFEEKDPFHSKRSDYIWWKVTNPVNLNNILYQNNIRSPLMFNPVVMMAHYKHRHLIIGIFTHISGRKYVVCGVPGMHLVDRKPFGELSTWVQTERNRLQYGAFGYWLVYINPDDGKIMNLSQQ